MNRLRAAWCFLAVLTVNAVASPASDIADTPGMSALSFEQGEGFRMSVDGPPGDYRIDFSADLMNWSPFYETKVGVGPVELLDPDSATAAGRFYRIGGVSVLPEYHTLLSIWGLQAEPGISTFLSGFDQSDAVFIDEEEERIIVRRPAKAFARISIQSDGTVATAGDYDIEPVRLTGPASLAEGGVTVHPPEETPGNDQLLGWDLPLRPLGAFGSETGIAEMLSGTAARRASLAAGVGERYEFVQAFAARKSESAGIDDLVGEWGIVRLEIESSPDENLYTVLSAPVTITAGDGGTFSVQGIEIETELIHFFDGSPPVRRYFEPREAEFSFPINVSSRGEVVVRVEGFGREDQNDQNLAGFMSPAGDFLALAEGWPAIYDVRRGEVPDGAGDGFAAHQLFLGVRKDAGPDLAGREYRIEGQSFWVSRWGFEMIPSGAEGKAGTLAFGPDGDATLTLEDLIVSLPFYDQDGGGIEVNADEPPDELPLPYTVAPDGRLSFDMSGLMDPGDDAFFTGFAQEGGRVLVLALGFASEGEDGGDEGQISMWVATCVNCD